ncbi:hypothetical protein Syun_019280 [Stephania yunnanensis]|uniref:IREH1/IRE-like N-terminal domain-containing protein n=1 Tax=Stephania yunnanensis TaxID=152371 RepID=A0AAP0ITT7_9MAGN
MLGNQGEERSRFCDSHGGCALGDPHGRVEESIRQAVREAEECSAEIEEIVKRLAMAGDHDKITAMINLLTNDLLNSASDDPAKFYGGPLVPPRPVTEKKKKAKDRHGNTGNACAQEHRTNRKKGGVILLTLDNCVSLQSVYMLTIRRPNASGQDCKFSQREKDYIQAAKDIHPNAKLLGSLHSRFDAAKGVVNDELSHFSRDVKEFLAKEHSSPRGQKEVEDLLSLAQQCTK